MISQFSGAEVPLGSHGAEISGVGRTAFLPGSSGENLFSCFWRPLHFLGFTAPSPHLQSQEWPRKSSLCCITLSLTLLPRSFTDKDPCDHIPPPPDNSGYSLHLKILNHICKVPFATEGSIFRALGIGGRHLGGIILSIADPVDLTQYLLISSL